MRKLLPLLLVLCAQPALAANIDVTPQQGDAPAVVLVRGVLRLEDIETFQFKVAGVSKAVVALDSDGGSLLAGIRIGTLIRLRNFVTLVPSGAVCASACAVAWLGGARRFMALNAKIGFHAAYRNEGGLAIETGAGNAILGAYLSQIGLSETAIVYITQAPPHVMTWLTMSEAARHQIEVQLFASQAVPPISSVTPKSLTPQDVVGPTVELERHTKVFVASLHAAWSSSTYGVPLALEHVYAEQVQYYGKDTHRSDIIADKNRFASRWPQRKYDLRESSLAVRCTDRAICSATGMVDWATFNPSTMARARGSAEFQYSIEWSGGAPKIILEAGNVVERDRSPASPRKSGVGWWVVLASFGAGGGTTEIHQGVKQITGAAYLCGLNAFNASSFKFTGFAPGYEVVVVGPYARRTEAETSRQRASVCVSGSYLKYASYRN